MGSGDLGGGHSTKFLETPALNYQCVQHLRVYCNTLKQKTKIKFTKIVNILQITTIFVLSDGLLEHSG